MPTRYAEAGNCQLVVNCPRNKDPPGTLYRERTDSVSVRCTYRDSRAASATVDTCEGVEFIGYQMAKMSDHPGAIELLKANAADYPRSASRAVRPGPSVQSSGRSGKGANRLPAGAGD